MSEAELISHIQKLQESNNFTDGYTNQQKALHRLNNLAQSKPSMIRKAAVLDINKSINLPSNTSRRKNKNDFYRFLLATSNN